MSTENEDVLKALSSSTRRTIMKQISEKGSATYTEIMNVLGLDPSLMSGKFNYHLKELSEAGLIERTNSEYRITDSGKRALIFVDQVAKEAKGEAKVDQYGVLSAVMSMSAGKELDLFASQMGIIFGVMFTMFSIFTELNYGAGNLSFWLGRITLPIALMLAIISTANMIRILKKFNVGFSVLLFLSSDWFFIRSPNRNIFFGIGITAVIAAICSFFTIILPFVGEIAMFSIQWYGLILGTIGFSVLAFTLSIRAKRKADHLDAINGEY